LRSWSVVWEVPVMVLLPGLVAKRSAGCEWVVSMPIRACQWCRAPIYPADTGRPVQFCRPACRQAARREGLLREAYRQPWQRKALAEGWRPPDRPR
jgi:hypothetical protein